MTQEPKIFPYIARLLQGAEVVWKTLGEVAEIKTGQTVSKNIIAENTGNYPVINSGREPLGFINTWNTDNDPIGITSRGAGVGSVTWQEGKYFRGNLNYSVSIHDSSILDTRFLYYLLLQMQIDIQALCTFQGIPALNAANLKKLSIPLPPLSVQQEIVRILDKFTQLEAELEAELDCRKRQYEYYRNNLLTFNEIEGVTEIVWKTLGEVTEIIRGKRVVKKDLAEEGMFAVFQNSMKPLGYYNKSNAPAQTTFIICAGAAGEIGFMKDAFWAADDVYYFKNNQNLNNKYLYYFLLTQQIKISQQVRRASIPRLSKSSFDKLLIPLPPLEEQERIASILDKFYTLVNSISEGLPKEIALRRKQYEYYREQLLTFTNDK